MVYAILAFKVTISFFFSFMLTDVPMCDCKDLKDKGGFTKSGLYKINLNDDKGEFVVFCDMNLQGGGWTIIQRRVDNSTSFNRGRKEYSGGFGNFNSNFWLGLKKMQRMTDSASHELYIGMESFVTASSLAYAKYSTFSLGTDANDYPLTISGYDTSSTAGNAFVDHHGEKFSTPDDDNDASTSNCAETFSSGWWFHDCHDSHLNGIYYHTGFHPTGQADGIIYDTWLSSPNSLKTVVMAIRRT